MYLDCSSDFNQAINVFSFSVMIGYAVTLEFSFGVYACLTRKYWLILATVRNGNCNEIMPLIEFSYEIWNINQVII